MNSPARIPTVHAIADTFEVWRIASADGPGFRKGEVYFSAHADSFENAQERGLFRTPHKEYFIARRIDGLTGEETLRLFVVRQGKPVWRHDPETKVTRQVRPHYAEEVCDLLLSGMLAKFGERG